MTLAKLNNQNAPCHITWTAQQDNDLDSLSFADCTVLYETANKAFPPGACNINLTALASLRVASGQAEREEDVSAPGGVALLVQSPRTIVAAVGSTASPRRLIQNTAMLTLIPLTLRNEFDVRRMFLTVARSTIASEAYQQKLAHIFKGFKNVTGLYIQSPEQATDERVSVEQSVELSERAVRYVTDLVAEEFARSQEVVHVYLAVDGDAMKFNTIVARLTKVGGVVINQDAPRTDSLLDFFALADCERIVMGHKYSSLSVAAALLRRRILINFVPAAQNTMLAVWQNLLRLEFPEEGSWLSSYERRTFLSSP
jgi:predicted small secreted protein